MIAEALRSPNVLKDLNLGCMLLFLFFFYNFFFPFFFVVQKKGVFAITVLRTGNSLGSAGAEALSEILPSCSLLRLSLEGNFANTCNFIFLVWFNLIQFNF